MATNEEILKRLAVLEMEHAKLKELVADPPRLSFWETYGGCFYILFVVIFVAVIVIPFTIWVYLALFFQPMLR